MMALARRSWPGALSILLAVAAVGMYWLATVVSANPDPRVFQYTNLFDFAVQVSTTTSAIVGFLAILRARRGHGGLVTAIIGLILGGVLTLLWVAWFGMLIVNPGALGD